MSNAQARHAQFYLTYAQTHPDDWHWFESEWAQIQRAWNWINARDDCAARVLESARAFIPFFEQRGMNQTTLEWALCSLQAARTLGDKPGELFSLSRLGEAHHRLGDFRRALELNEECLRLARELGDRASEAIALGDQARAYTLLGQARAAIPLHQQQVEILRQLGDRAREGNALTALGAAHFELAEFRRAIELYQQALAIARALNDKRGQAHALNNLANAHANLGEL